MKTLEPQKESFLDEKLREEFSDLLFEDKSYPDRKVVFEVMKYMINIWEIKVEDDKTKRKETGQSNNGEIELPLILPLVIEETQGQVICLSPRTGIFKREIESKDFVSLSFVFIFCCRNNK